jgi:hypothetical protein
MATSVNYFGNFGSFRKGAVKIAYENGYYAGKISGVSGDGWDEVVRVLRETGKLAYFGEGAEGEEEEVCVTSGNAGWVNFYLREKLDVTYLKVGNNHHTIYDAKDYGMTTKDAGMLLLDDSFVPGVAERQLAVEGIIEAMTAVVEEKAPEFAKEGAFSRW